MEVHFVVCMSNHFHLIVSPKDAEQLADFMGRFKSKLAKEINRLHDWEGPVWHDRYQLIPISEEPEARIERLRYLIAQGAKEDLVEHPLDWPGVHAVKHWVRGEAMLGTWIDRTAIARSGSKPGDVEKHTQELELELTPFPGYSPEAFRELVKQQLERVVEEETARRRVEGKRVLGARKILRQHPHQRSPKPKRRKQPLIHAVSRAVRERYHEALRWFLEAYRKAAGQLREGVPKPEFPPGCFPPSGPFVPLPAL
jgi:putative transposase